MHFAVCRHDNRTQGQRIAYLHYVPNQRNTDQFLARLGIIQQHGVLTNFDHLPSKLDNCGHTSTCLKLHGPGQCTSARIYPMRGIDYENSSSEDVN